MIEEKYYREAANRIDWCSTLADWKYSDEYMAVADNVTKSRGNYPVGTGDSKGYRVLGVTIDSKRKRLLLHRVVLYKSTLTIPNQVDHIDGNPLNNSIGNLRSVDGFANQRNRKMQYNNTSGHTGVCWDKNHSKWMARIGFNGKHKTLGYFTNLEDAVKARQTAQAETGGFTERHGK